MSEIDKLIEALTIFKKYVKGALDDGIHAEHDVIYAGPDEEDVISSEDRIRLEELGWFFSEDSWQMFT